MHGLKWYDYGARWYDPLLASWNRPDPSHKDYYPWSPYAYCGDNPIMFVDPDGKKILFVNGYWNSYFGWLIGSSYSGKAYWGNNFTSVAQIYFNDYSTITDNNFIDGSSKWGGDMSGADRWKAGYQYAINNIESLTNGMKGDETFNMVTHSEGSAYGAGLAKGLIDMGYTVSEIVHLSADEGDEFITPKEPFTLQLAYDKDWVTGNKIIKNTDKFGLIDSSTLSWTQVHGFTKSSSIFKAVQDLKTALIYNNIGLYKGVFTSWWDVIPGSIHNDTFFTNINGFKLGQ